jgi:hypothetical protein
MIPGIAANKAKRIPAISRLKAVCMKVKLTLATPARSKPKVPIKKAMGKETKIGCKG